MLLSRTDRIARRRGSFFLGTVFAVSLSGCQAISAAGPLLYGSDDGSSTEMCAKAAPGRSVLFGDTVTAPDGAAVTILGTRLIGAVGIEMAGNYILQIPVDDDGDHLAIGTLNLPTDSTAWADRVSSTGAVIPAGSTRNIVSVLKRNQASQGSAQRLEITYEMGNMPFVERGTMRYVIAGKCFEQ